MTCSSQPWDIIHIYNVLLSSLIFFKYLDTFYVKKNSVLKEKKKQHLKISWHKNIHSFVVNVYISLLIDGRNV